MENLTGFQKRKKEWCLIYKNKYVLRVGNWLTIDKIIEKIPAVCQVEYRLLHISVCNDLIFVCPKPSKYEKNTETH